jgi:hypothetical protein
LPLLVLISCATGVLFRRVLTMPLSSRVFTKFFSSSFKVLGLTFRSLIHFELIFV